MELYVKIKVLNDNYIEYNVQTGDIGYVLRNYGDGHYEVQFWDESVYPPVSLAVTSVDGKDITEVQK